MLKGLQKIKSSPYFIALLLLTAVLYSINFHINDIWTENESFYAEAVREMFESGNFIDIYYNYALRFNKPPLTYWMIASSVSIFGNTEFAIRLPVLISAFLTTVLTYKTAKLLHGKETAVLAFAMQAISIQFIAGKQYASPEIPLAFFFSLTLYLFIKGKTTRKSIYTVLGAIALGLTVLTKGYPYFIVIGGIIGLYLLIDTKLDREKLINELKFLRLPLTLPLALLIGTGWLIMMYYSYNDTFTEVLQRETLDRAFTQSSKGLRDLLFYPEVILWSFFPYSIIFYISLVSAFRSFTSVKKLSFALSWFVVMLVVFTIAKGKIPTYFIQAHPAMAILASHYLVTKMPENRLPRTLVQSSLLIPALLGIAGSLAMIQVFELNILSYSIPAVALFAIVIPFRLPKTSRHRQTLFFLQPFSGAYAMLMIMATGVMPQLEQFRPYDQIGTAIRKISSLDTDLPIFLQDGKLYNLPYYAERKMIHNADPATVQKQEGPVLALLQSRNILPENRKHIYWSGKIYRYRSSESRLLIYIQNHLRAKKGDFSGYRDYSLFYRE